jgi:hypothetical protein
VKSPAGRCGRERCAHLLLSDLLAQPELLEPPAVILPHLAWEGRVSLLASEEKLGKSTLAGQAVAHLVRGAGFLNGLAPARAVLWLALDEPLPDLVRRLHRFGARSAVAIMTERPSALVLQQIAEELGAGLIVVDTLSEFADGLVEDQNAAEQWTAPLRLLRSVAQTTGAGVLLLHHTNRSTGKYRGSSQIGAGVDAILEMAADSADPMVRVVKSRGRVCLETFRLRYSEEHGYELEGGELPNRPTSVLLFPGRGPDGREQLVTDFRKTLDSIAVAADFLVREVGNKGKVTLRGRFIRTKVFRHTYCTARLQTLDRGAPVSLYTVSRELGHGSTRMVERVYSHLGQVRHRADVVEFRPESDAPPVKVGSPLRANT